MRLERIFTSTGTWQIDSKIVFRLCALSCVSLFFKSPLFNSTIDVMSESEYPDRRVAAANSIIATDFLQCSLAPKRCTILKTWGWSYSRLANKFFLKVDSSSSLCGYDLRKIKVINVMANAIFIYLPLDEMTRRVYIAGKLKTQYKGS
jgi:hypothetical protein